MKAIITVGVGATGKSKFAEQLDSSWVRIERDQFREYILVKEKKLCTEHENIWKYWNFKWEKDVDVMVATLLKSSAELGKNVIFSDTNLHESHRENLKTKLEGLGYVVEVMVFGQELNLDELWKRDYNRKNTLGHMTIMDQYARFREQFPKHVLKDVTNKPECVIFDIDGTLAEDMVNRKPYEWSKVGSDTYDELLFVALIAFRECGYNIVLMSGRDEVCRKETESWFVEGIIKFGGACRFDYELFMRPLDDQRKDSIIKTELFYKHVDGNYKVVGVFDDRPSVIRNVWHEFGFRTYSVGKNYVEF